MLTCTCGFRVNYLKEHLYLTAMESVINSLYFHENNINIMRTKLLQVHNIQTMTINTGNER